MIIKLASLEFVNINEQVETKYQNKILLTGLVCLGLLSRPREVNKEVYL